MIGGAAVAAAVGCGSTTGAITYPSAAAAGMSQGCGEVTYPETGVTESVFVVGGSVSCTDAMAVVDRYLHDPSLEHVGNTWSAQFDGWGCASPTATAAQIYGYSTSCRRDGDEIQIRSSTIQSAEPLSNSCDTAAIARDLGQNLNVERCYGDWAYVSTGELGDAQSLLRVADGRWTRYTGFPSSYCRDQAQSAGAPGPELRSFPDC
ncbi:hypothetical protein CYL16_12180 [Mycobacterium sp. EPG1]|nr:hypothetical protein CYL16_12180 [Mycobacterium sp. EPG1]